jgi:EpsI family protein
LSTGRYIVLLLVFAAGIALSLLVGTLADPLVSAKTRDLKLPFSEFPSVIGAWVGTERPLTAKELGVLGLDSHLRRVYVDQRRRSAVLYLTYYGNKARGMEAIYHNATICFPSAGWELTRTDRRTIRLNDVARKFDVSLDHFRKSGNRLVVLSFFVVDGEVLEESPRNTPIWLALDKLQFSSDPGYFAQVQVVVMNEGDEEETEQTAADLLEEAGRYIFLHF